MLGGGGTAEVVAPVPPGIPTSTSAKLLVLANRSSSGSVTVGPVVGVPGVLK